MTLSGVPGENEKLACMVSLSGVSKNSKLTLPVDNKLVDAMNKHIVAITVKPFLLNVFSTIGKTV